MKKRLGVILPVIALVVALGATGVFAAVKYVTGDMVFLYSPPASVVAGALESSDEVYVFNEKQNVFLSSDLLTDDSKTIPAGTSVNSHLVHFDPVGVANVVISVSGTVNFDGDILGLYTTNDGLDGTDATFGLTGTAYPTGSPRFLEVTGVNADTATVDGSKLAVDLHANTGIDQIRVITRPHTPTWVGGEVQSVDKIELVWQWIKGILLQVFGLNSSA
ncbi:MAG: hypothetical protein JW732_07215 [Dehalococcoidia bacterium]|nr:hypothetical protein [Dehalococcoidia bacterium]